MHAHQHPREKARDNGVSALIGATSLMRDAWVSSENREPNEPAVAIQSRAWRSRTEAGSSCSKSLEPISFQPTPEAVNYQWVLRNAMSLIEQDLAKVETCIQRGLAASDPSVQTMLDHVRTLGGKRLRPCLTLLAARACGGVTEETIRLAAAIELVHTATLVHDDILDDASERRHRPTTHTLWGVTDAVLLGDWLFTHAYELANQGESTYPGRCIARAAKLVCEGEIRQGRSIGDFDLTEENYFDILGAKTGALCEVSCRLGAWSANAPDSVSERFAQYGYALGIAFQIYDDWLDVWGDVSVTGKTLGTDLASGKPTLPTIFTLSRPAGQSARELLSSDRPDRFECVRASFDEAGASEYTMEVAHQWGKRAIHHLSRTDGMFPIDHDSVHSLQLLAYAATHRAG